MEHLAESRLIENLWDGTVLNEAERTHLSVCGECQEQVATFTLMRDELTVARLSQPSVAAEKALFAIFEQVKPNAKPTNLLENLLGSVAEWVNALPLWDSRQQASATGIRNVSKSSYRLLFGANDTEVELMVEPQNGLLRVVGEVMSGDAEASNGLALIELARSPDAKRALETESDATGRFLLEGVAPGSYTMTITPRYSQVVVIEPLELT